ncbi:Uncharacterised protein [Mycobacteroides abscessus subsp. abscessus]|nr:Uncharacterised protein [Mycobacteroides abscessus subsp. abscessus]
MRGQILGVGQCDHMPGDLFECRFGVVHDVDTAQEGLHGQPTGVPRASGGG